MAMVAAVFSLPATGARAAGQAQVDAALGAEVVRLPFPQEDGSLTPYTFELGYSLLTLVYDTLLWRDEKGVPQPLLAKAVETSPDGLRVTIRLAEGALWHDGAPVTSADVAFTLRFVASHPHPRFTPQVAGIEKVDTPDPATVLVTLRHPSPGFADQPLADVPILPQHLWQKLPAGRLAPEGNPVGSGPYRLVEHRPGERYRFEANAGWFGGAPPVKVIEVPIITDAEQTFNALERRLVDMIPVSLPEGIDDRLRRLGTRVVRGTSYLGTALLLNTRRPPFDRPEVRQAVAGSIDLVRIARLVENVVPAEKGYLHPESSWAPPEPVQRFDAARARAALRGLNLPPIVILAPDNDPVKVETARQVALALERSGAKAQSKPMKRDELARAVGENGDVPTFEAAIGSIPPLASYDPDFLRPLFGSVTGPAAVLNVTGYRSGTFDQLADRIAGTADPAGRKAAVSEALRLLAADAPAVPLFFTEGSFVYRPAIFDGWVFVEGTGILDKRSFAAPSQRPADPGSSGGGTSETPESFPLWLVAVALFGVAFVLAVIALTLRR
ncbi:MAG TPA: ABC transporter substrate-binding protein [Acidimicrobiales bacterium]|nr:ABC transporter substrate-binding protein [Acidimicrobiales bacterium]